MALRTAAERSAAGNAANALVSVTRDTVAPALTLDPYSEHLETGTLSLTGSTDGDFVSVNGIILTLGPGGDFATDLGLSPGMNRLEVRTWDEAGNEDVHRFAVVYAAPARSPGVAGWLLAVLAAVALVGGFFGGLLFQRLQGPPGPSPEAPPPLEPQPPIAGDEAPPVTPATPTTAPPTPDERAARLEKAYGDGRITKETYERNLAALQKDATVAAPVVAPTLETAEAVAPTEEADPRLARLEKALQEGKISQQVYDQNVKKLKGAPKG